MRRGFPRPRGRGPVEAFICESSVPHGLYFRARAGAAPLKPVSAPAARHFAPDFRARAGAAPLKPFRRCFDQIREDHFRARAGAAPLKHSGTIAVRDTELQISAPARARPR